MPKTKKTKTKQSESLKAFIQREYPVWMRLPEVKKTEGKRASEGAR